MRRRSFSNFFSGGMATRVHMSLWDSHSRERVKIKVQCEELNVQCEEFTVRPTMFRVGSSSSHSPIQLLGSERKLFAVVQ